MTRTREAQTARSTSAPPDAWRVEVFKQSGRPDPEGEHVGREIRELGATGVPGADGVRGVRLGRGYLLSPSLSREAVREIAADLLADPVLDEARVTAPRERPTARGPGAREREGARESGARESAASKAAHRILVAPLPGVMDPVANTLERLLRRAGHESRVGTFRAYELEGELSRDKLLEIGRRALANETIERLLVDSEDLSFAAPGGGSAEDGPPVALREASDARLTEISRLGGLSLSPTEMRAIQSHFREVGREPSVCELETIAQTWSEHCKHKTLTGVVEMDGERIDNVLKSTIFAATRELDKPWCVSVFHDNAGIVEFDAGQDVCFKVETHNHPSAIDPYGGAGTGIGGVIRDVLGVGLGARPIACTDAFFVGPLDLPADELPKGCLHPRRILRGVVAGVRDYGNRMGIPTVSGGVWHHERYVGNPLVYAGTVGILPHRFATKSVQPGDHVVVVGGRTGRDGIHGATFSSAELTEESETVSSGAVQIGDPITEKTVLDCQLQARDRGLYRAVTDCGAGGYSSAVGEMGAECGASVDLDRAPLKYAGLAPHEIWISEAQERMVLAVPTETLDELLALFASEDVEAHAIGRFTDDGRLVVRHAGKVVCDLDMGFLHDGAPRPVRQASWTPPALPDPGCPAPSDWRAAVLALASAPDSGSREWIVRQYDHEVQGMSVLKPLVGARADGPGDAAVLRPLPESKRGLALACGAYPRYGLLDPEAMALAAIDEALRNVVAVGADPTRAALLDNFSWGNCDKPDRLGSLVLAAKACRAASLAYEAPFISGKDSLNNEYRAGGETIAIPPTLLISALAPVPDVARAVSMDAKDAGDALYLVGETRAELGGSSYLGQLGLDGGRVPRPDLARAPRLLRALHGALSGGLARACHDLSEGGLALAAAEMAFAGERGIELALAAVPLAGDETADRDPDAVRLFSESCTRFLVEVAPQHTAAFERALEGLPLARVGRVTDGRALVVRGSSGSVLAEVSIDDVRAAHTGGFGG